MLLDKTTLGELSIDNKGYYGIAASAVDYSEELYTYLRITDITDDGRIDYTNLKSVNDANAGNYLLKPNDIVFARTGGSTGRNYFYDGSERKFVYAGFLIKFSLDDKKVNPRFIKYYCQSSKYKNWITSYNTGSTRGNINAQTYANMEIELPPRYYQDRIVLLLDTIENKLLLNNAINNNLEQQMDCLFLNFISNNADIEYKVKDVILTANTGADAIQKAPIVNYNTGIKCVRVGDMSNDRSIYDWGCTKITDSIFKQYQLKKDDIIITRTATLGLNKLITDDLNAVYNNGLIRISIDKNKVLPLFLYRQFQTNNFFSFINRIEAETSVRPNMKINYLLSYPFKCSNIELQKELVAILEPMLKKQVQIKSENQKLTQLRDTLLPKLMSGEIDVSKVEIDNILENQSTDKLLFSEDK